MPLSFIINVLVFRLSRDTFTYLHGIIAEDLMRTVPGNPTIPSTHQLMIALWKMATMDSYRQFFTIFNYLPKQYFPDQYVIGLMWVKPQRSEQCGESPMRYLKKVHNTYSGQMKIVLLK